MRSVFANRKKRGSDEIMASMLFIAKQGSSKTGIMYANYLSFSQLKKYIDLALKNRMIYLNSDGRYFTTPKGLAYLKCFEELHNVENIAVAKRKLLGEILTGEGSETS